MLLSTLGGASLLGNQVKQVKAQLEQVKTQLEQARIFYATTSFNKF